MKNSLLFFNFDHNEHIDIDVALLCLEHHVSIFSMELTNRIKIKECTKKKLRLKICLYLLYITLLIATSHKL
jgi:hypothetical protein